MTTQFPSRLIKERALGLGFNLVGITPAIPSPHLRAYFRWLDAGQHGEMGYMARPDRVARRRDLNVILPGVRSLVIVGLDYHDLALPLEILNDPSRGRIAAYAWGADYHALMSPRLEALGEFLRARGRGAVRHRAYVDTGAILERSHAHQAGLGFIGKNTMLIHPRRGSDFFLGELLTDLEFDAYDAPQPESMCGRCTRCLNACPTGAFPQPYVLDARLCISYLTIEHPGWIDRGLRPQMGNWVFGCDICQTVCPWQRFAIRTKTTQFFPITPDRAAPPLAQLLELDATRFKAMFQGTAIERAGRAQLVRNACIAAANGRQPGLGRLIETLLLDVDPIVRGHAGWALGRLHGALAAPTLGARLNVETDPAARYDLQQTLDELAFHA